MNTNSNKVNNPGNFNNSSFQRTIVNNSNQKKKNNFVKTVFVPFLSGVVGASLVIGASINIPSFRKLFIPTSSSSQLSESINYNNINTNLISLSNFSDTGVYVAQKVLPSVVGIKVSYSVSSVFSQRSATATAEGSGVIISEDGYILTNNHVIDTSSQSSYSSYYELEKASSITVSLYDDSEEYSATVIGTDEQTDLAVIKIDKSDLVPAVLGDSSSLQVGEWCMAIGNPLGMESSVTTGSISALNREISDSDGKTYALIQTDTAINEGNSGGALVNSNGEVIGINTLKASGTGVEGLGFAIPINTTKSIYSDLVTYNKVIRPYIGIVGIDITDQIIKENPTAKLVKGAYVRTVADFSPAQKAGIKPGDIIIAFNGEKVETMRQLNSLKEKCHVDDVVTLTVMRDGKEQSIELKLAEQP